MFICIKQQDTKHSIYTIGNWDSKTSKSLYYVVSYHFLLKFWGENGRRQKVDHSDLVMIQNTAQLLDVLPQQVW